MTTTEKLKMTSRVWSKPVTQDIIKQLRNAGLVVDKLSSGYECKINGHLVFKAMIGSQGYLVRYDEKLFS